MYACVRSANAGTSGSPRRLRIRYPRLRLAKLSKPKTTTWFMPLKSTTTPIKPTPKAANANQIKNVPGNTTSPMTSTMPITHQRESPSASSIVFTDERSNQVLVITWCSLPSVASVTNPVLVSSVMPSILASRALISVAMRSITFCSSASDAVRLVASRTVFSAHSILRPRSSAKPRICATASFTTLRSRLGSIASPSPRTGVAEPILVAGAIAAT